MKCLVPGLIAAGVLCAQTKTPSVIVTHVTANMCAILTSIGAGLCQQGVTVIVSSADPQSIAFRVNLTYTRADGTAGTESAFVSRQMPGVAAAWFPLEDVTNIAAQVTALKSHAVVNAETQP